MLDGDLAGQQRAAAGVAVVEDLEEVVPSLSREGGEPPVVEDEEPGPGEPLDDLGIRSVAPGEGEFVEKAGDAVVARGDADSPTAAGRPIGANVDAVPKVVPAHHHADTGAETRGV